MKNIKQRLIGLQILTVALVLSVCTFFFGLNQLILIKEGEENKLRSIAQILAINLEPTLAFSDHSEANKILSSLKFEPSIECALLLVGNQERFAEYVNQPLNGSSSLSQNCAVPFSSVDSSSVPFFSTASSSSSSGPSSNLKQGIHLSQGRLYYSHPILVKNQTTGHLILTIGANQILSNYKNYTWLIIVVFSFGILFSILISTLTQKTLSKPISQLAELAKAVSRSGNYSLRADIEYSSQSVEELHILSKEFNSVFETLETHTKERADLLSKEKAAIEASQLKSEFLANMSHEMRTPLNGILGLTELIQDTVLNNIQKDYVDAINRSATAMSQIVNDILDFSKIEAGQLDFNHSAFSFREIFKDLEILLSPLIDPSQVRLSFSLDSNLNQTFLGDSGRIRQILTNLTSNAIKFTHQGSVQVRGKVISTTQAMTEILCEVEDTGIGISEESQKRLFNPFVQADSSTTRKYGGTGLGLSISKLLIEKMAGSIGVKSTLGKGSLFWFKIQLEASAEVQPPANRQSSNQLPKSGSIAHTKILVGEDNLINQTVIMGHLKALNFQATLAKTGREVLENLESDVFDLLLLDCHMPEMDGYEVSKRIREESRSFQKIPIIACTASAMDIDREKCLATGMNDILTKPITRQKLLSIIEKWHPQKT